VPVVGDIWYCQGQGEVGTGLQRQGVLAPQLPRATRSSEFQSGHFRSVLAVCFVRVKRKVTILCDHGVKKLKSAMSRWILGGNCHDQGVYITKGLILQLPGCRNGPWASILCDHKVKS